MIVAAAAYVAALIAIDIPGVAHKEIALDIERRACGIHYRARVTGADGRKVPATADVTCAK